MAMRPVQHRLALILPALLLVACGDRREKEDDTSATPADQVVQPAAPAQDGTADAEAGATPGTSDVAATTPPPPAEGAASQAEALGLLATASEHEVAAADQAIAKKVTGDVLAFANMMKTDHGKNLAETSALGATPETARITQMRSKGEADLAALDAKTGTQYEQAYIDAMVKGHTEVLALLDSTLIPAATDAAVKTHFANTRTAVAKHLDEARKLKAGE
jgi:putative membrane protein